MMMEEETRHGNLQEEINNADIQLHKKKSVLSITIQIQIIV